jgi:hypothetical protein
MVTRGFFVVVDKVTRGLLKAIEAGADAGLTHWGLKPPPKIIFLH